MALSTIIRNYNNLSQQPTKRTFFNTDLTSDQQKPNEKL
ncbi:hypothetical protein PL2TA16_04549 [Pseudoalteromonas luteoviolacea 2ta16]|uniref:Uncharacterized protein n=1 Tax=Pseudoalteromonas luteoviolacea (strain 2ta16) TaxID=1353533 RepID=V4HYX6_PSEL2|nr:hypothetical protein PL2TA16_04549 [Pseudoalteromonas luteoviolacea 2ta16]